MTDLRWYQPTPAAAFFCKWMAVGLSLLLLVTLLPSNILEGMAGLGLLGVYGVSLLVTSDWVLIFACVVCIHLLIRGAVESGVRSAQRNHP